MDVWNLNVLPRLGFAFAAISNKKFNIYFMKFWVALSLMPLAARVTHSDSDTFLEYFYF